MVDNRNNLLHSVNEDKDDFVIDLLVKLIKSLKNGQISMDIGNEPAMNINAVTNNKININLLDPDLLKLFSFTAEEEEEDKYNGKRDTEKRHGFMGKIKDKLDTAKEYAEILTGKENALSDDLDIAREFGKKLTDNDITVSFLEKASKQ